MENIKYMFELMGYDFHFNNEMNIWSCSSPDSVLLGGATDIEIVINLAIDHKIKQLLK